MQQPSIWINYIFCRCGYRNSFGNKVGRVMNRNKHFQDEQQVGDDYGESNKGGKCGSLSPTILNKGE